MRVAVMVRLHGFLWRLDIVGECFNDSWYVLIRNWADLEWRIIVRQHSRIKGPFE